MSASAIYIAVAIVILGIIALLVLTANREIKERRLRPLAGLAFAFVAAGIETPVDGFVGFRFNMLRERPGYRERPDGEGVWVFHQTDGVRPAMRRTMTGVREEHEPFK